MYITIEIQKLSIVWRTVETREWSVLATNMNTERIHLQNLENTE